MPPPRDQLKLGLIYYCNETNYESYQITIAAVIFPEQDSARTAGVPEPEQGSELLASGELTI